MSARIDRWLDALARRRWWIPALAIVACAPALLGGVELDDLFLEQLARDGRALTFDAFAFFGDRGGVTHLAGADLPWWTEPGFRLDLLRPLAGLTHQLDWSLWPDSPWAMHLHSLLWYAGLVALVGLLHRGARQPASAEARRAALATLIFALSQAHGMNVGWVAARNSVIGALLGAAAMLAHRAWRSRGATHGAWLGPLAFGAALLANEGAVAILSYLVAGALMLERRPGRLWALVPYFVVALGWRALSSLQGFGAAASGMYLEPSTAPLEYLARTAVHGALLLAARFGVAVVDGLGAVPGAYPVAAALALPFLAILAWLLVARARADAAVRAWALGTLGTVATAGALLPTDRNLLILGFGGSFLIADLITHGLSSEAGRARRAVAIGLAVVHVALSALLLPLRVGSSRFVQSMAEPIEAALPRDAEVDGRAVVLVQAPSDLVMLYARVMRRLDGGPVPARITYLYAGPGALTLERRAEDVIALRSSAPWLAAPLDRMFRSDVDFAVGERIPGPCFDSVIEELDEALPRAVRFELHGRGEGCSPSFMAWRGSAPVPLELPPVGETIELAPALLPAAE